MQHDPTRYRVFLAEDDRGVLELIRIRLAVAGYQVSYARDGVDALKGIGHCRPDGVILDINMPELDGFGVLQALRSHSGTSRIPVMMLTARNTPQDVQKAIALGASDFLAKPFRDDLLLLRVARLVQSAERSPRDEGAQVLI